jgi:hypothetical protein
VNVATRPKAAWWAALAAALFLARSAPPVAAHAGTADGSRPFVTTIEPAVPGIAASAVFAGSWQINLFVVNGEDVSVLDEHDRPFLRLGRQGTEGDYAAPAWYTSAVAPNDSGLVRLPDGVGPDTPPNWKPVSKASAWSWFDPRIRSAPGAVTPDMIKQAVPVRLGDFSIPFRVGERTARINGYVEFEPPKGRYVHTLLSPERPAAGVEIGLLAGQAVPTLTVRNDSGPPVTILGADGEPFLRVGTVVEANLASPAWVQVGRALGRTPRAVADPAAEPQWDQISGGHLLSWADFRSRPPDSEPPAATLRSGRPIEVRRWTIPYRIGGQAAEIRGVTTFEPFRPPSRHPDHTGLLAAAAGALVVGATVLVGLRRRGSRSPRSRP